MRLSLINFCRIKTPCARRFEAIFFGLRQRFNVFKFLVLTLVFFSTAHSLCAQVNLSDFTHSCDEVLEEAITSGSIPGGVLAIVTSDSVMLLKGYGVRETENKKVVDTGKSLFQLGSVGKVLTAISVLQLVENGQLSLDADVNNYLTNWTIDNPFDKKITLRHLLTHSAGLDEQYTGYMARSKDEVQPLEEHLSKHLPAISREPGTQINYSNYGYGLAGLVVQNAGELPFEEYVDAHIFSPLRMESTTYQLPVNNEYSVKGYSKKSQSFEQTTTYPRHTTPAGSVSSTGADMAIFLQWLLRKDTLLSASGFNGLFERQFSPHENLGGYTFGFEEQEIGGKKAFSKGGSVPGFSSQIIVFPKEDIALFASINVNPTNVLDSLAHTLRSLFEPPTKNTEKADFKLTEPDRFVGIYRNNRHSTDKVEELFQLYQSPIEIRKGEKESIEMILNGWLYECTPVSDSVFLLNSEPPKHLVFTNFKDGKPNTFFTSVEINGLDLPVTYSRTKWYETPRFVNDIFPGIVFTLIGMYLILPIFWGLVWFVNKFRRKKLKVPYLTNQSHLLGLLFSGLTVWHLLGFLFPLARRREELLLGFPSDLEIFEFVHWSMVFVAVLVLIQTIRIWLKKEGWIGIRIYYSLFALASIAIILFMHRWHFLNLQ